MTGEINNRIYGEPLKSSGKSTSGDVKTSQNGTTGTSGSIFTFKPDAKISQNQLGTKEETESFFREFDLDGDGLISARNSKGVNELELLNKRYEEIKNDRSATKPPSSNPVVKMYNKVVNFFKNDTGKEIYRDGQIVTADGVIDAAYQGNIGDCWLLSRMNAMSNTDFGEEAIRNAVGENGIIQNNDGSHTIKIDRINAEYTFSRDEIQNAIESGKYSDGDLDVLLFEMAFERHYDEALSRLDEIDIKEGRATTSSGRINEDGTVKSSIDGGETGNDYSDPKDFRNKDIISIMTGSDHLYASTPEEKQQVLELKAAHQREIAVTFSSKYAIELGEDGRAVVSEINPDSNNGSETHAYELKRVETDENGVITNIIAVNPWNNEEEIPLSEEEFKKYCIDIDFDTKNENITGKFNTHKNQALAKDMIDKNEKFTNINERLKEIKDIAKFSKDIGGLREFHEKFMQNVDEQTSQLYNSWKNEGADGMNKYVGHEYWNNEEESTTYLNEFMQKSHEERVKLNKETFYTNLGFDETEINDLIQHPEKFEQYCQKHGYKY